MRFQILIYNNAEFDDALENGLKPELDEAHRSVLTELSASGELVDSNELSTDEAVVVRVDPAKPGSRITTDGPYSEAKEWVGGYYVVDVESIDRAIDIAARFVEARYSPIEVRQLVHSEATANPSA
ncbi:YciI family protein [Leifsonia poae]|uniref:YciI family protein n=1 Tax=Leifsonia poae TaxID=110933 RepID=UPI003D674A4A